MRISDWSSDVCSSDLWGSGPGPPQSAPAENRRSGIAEPDREQHRGQPIEEAVAFGGERDEAFEARLADLDVARRDRDDPPLADQIGLDRKSTRLNSSH